MENCFVMQPFDNGRFDKRYRDVFDPAIRKAGLEPYRVDGDPSVVIPIDEIADRIRKSEFCFAEITTDNPNVWFELGFAIACGKHVVMACSDERATAFPFDVRHRAIITYKVESPQDFKRLEHQIAEALKAAQKKRREIGTITNLSPIASVKGLSEHEIVTLAVTAQNMYDTVSSVYVNTIKTDARAAGHTDIAVMLALRSLTKKGFIELREEVDGRGESFTAYLVSDSGFDWLDTNQEKLVMKWTPPTSPPEPEPLPF